MIDYHTFCEIKRLGGTGLEAPRIAESLDLDVKTVRKWLAIEHYRNRQSPSRESILAAYKGLIARLLEQHSYTAMQLYRMIAKEGYTGGYTTVKDYVRLIRPPKRRAYLTVHYDPGEAAQVDWAQTGSVAVDGTRRQLSFFVMVLGYSRMLYLEFSLRQTMEHFLSCHRRAFEFFGGVPKDVIVDNCKTAVLSHKPGEHVIYNPRYMDFAQHYGVDLWACTPGCPNQKARVERAVAYVKSSFLNGLELSSLPAVQAAGTEWQNEVANIRTHGEIKEKPLERFNQSEAEKLRPLPRIPYDCSVLKTGVKSDCQFRVRLDTNKYSVPAQYASRANLSMRLWPERLCIYDGSDLIAQHQRHYGRHRDYENPDHVKPLLERFKKARDQRCLQQFLALGPDAETYYYGLRERRGNSLNHIRQILALTEVYNAEAVVCAMHDAATFHAFSADCIINTLETRNRPQPQNAPLHLTRNADVLDLELPPINFDIYNHE
jgi:transposase